MVFRVTVVFILLFMQCLPIYTKDSDVILIHKSIAKYEATDNIECINSMIDHIELVGLESFDLANIELVGLLANLYSVKAKYETLHGSDILAHDYFYRAIKLYESTGDDDCIPEIINNYIHITTTYLQRKDSIGMSKVVDEIKSYAMEYPNDITLKYFYSLVSSSFHAVRVYNENNLSFVDSFMVNAHRAVYYLADIPLETIKDANINPCVVYYNLATVFLLYKRPLQTDSVTYYMNRMADNVDLLQDPVLRAVEMVAFDDVYMWLYYYQKQYKKAEEQAHRVEELIDSVSNLYPNKFLMERAELYRFYVELHVAQNDYKSALKYRDLEVEVMQDIYDAKKNKDIRDLQLKYEVEKKDANIKSLNYKLSQQRYNMNFIIVIVVVVVMLLILSLVLVFLRNKNMLHKHYEAAIEADNELESSHSTDQIILDKMRMHYPKHAEAIDNVNIQKLSEVIAAATTPLTPMEKKYVIAFMAGIKAAELAKMFCVENTTVYSVKYRIKKKYTNIEFNY